MFDKILLLLTLASIAAIATGQGVGNWSSVVSITNSRVCTEAKRPPICTRECYEIIFSRLVEAIILKGKCTAYKIHWSPGRMSSWYECSKNDDQNKPCDSPDCMISSTRDDDGTGATPSISCWNVNSYKRWDKIILNGKVIAFKVKMSGTWSQWFKPQRMRRSRRKAF